MPFYFPVSHILNHSSLSKAFIKKRGKEFKITEQYSTYRETLIQFFSYLIDTINIFRFSITYQIKSPYKHFFRSLTIISSSFLPVLNNTISPANRRLLSLTPFIFKPFLSLENFLQQFSKIL